MLTLLSRNKDSLPRDVCKQKHVLTVRLSCGLHCFVIISKQKYNMSKSTSKKKTQNHKKKDLHPNSRKVKHIIDGYFCRFDDEIAETDRLLQMRGNTTQHAGRMDAIKMTLDKEKQEFRSATFEVPDLLSTDGFQIFRAWDLKESYLPKIKTRMVSPHVLAQLS
ncbi:translation machinery-associated protein 16-like isoform X2 [Varroa destructor]|uniref:Uncharacterized protein n=1 Tax=Varroa destructor TaxID=109461 RepID=A0A7M7J3N5_VARDE|nr:translation machinery-associated protein 16-like isoform X2 [Varroa destructor]